MIQKLNSEVPQGFTCLSPHERPEQDNQKPKTKTKRLHDNAGLIMYSGTASQRHPKTKKTKWCGCGVDGRAYSTPPSRKATSNQQAEQSKQAGKAWAQAGGFWWDGGVTVRSRGGRGRDSSSIETMRVGHKTISCRKDVTAMDSRDPTRGRRRKKNTYRNFFFFSLSFHCWANPRMQNAMPMGKFCFVFLAGAGNWQQGGEMARSIGRKECALYLEGTQVEKKKKN